MKTPPTLLLALAAALALAASAQAKGQTTATIWGASGSATVDDPAVVGLMLGDRWRLVDPPEPAPFYALDVRLGDHRPAQRLVLLWVPSARRVAGPGVMGGLEWYPVRASRARVLETAAGSRGSSRMRAVGPGRRI